MNTPLVTTESGIIDVVAQEDSIVWIGQGIVRLQPDDPSQQGPQGRPVLRGGVVQ